MPVEGLNKDRNLLKHQWSAFAKVLILITAPAILGIVIGMMIDSPENYTWTLTLMFAGLIIGALLSWYAAKTEMRHDNRDKLL